MAVGASAGREAGEKIVRGVLNLFRRDTPSGAAASAPRGPGGSVLLDDVTVPRATGDLWTPPPRPRVSTTPTAPTTTAPRFGAARQAIRENILTPSPTVQRLIDRTGGRSAGFALRRLNPRQITGLPLTLGAGALGYYGLRDNWGDPDLEARERALELISGERMSPEELQAQQMEAALAPYRREVPAVDPELQRLLEAQYGPIRQELTNLGQRGASAYEEGYADYAARAAAEAAALENLAAETGASVAGAGEAGAANIEDVLYGGGMDVSDTSGLAPVAGYLADMPGQTREAATAAGADARRNLELDAQGFVREADLMSQMGPAYARQLADMVALENMSLGQAQQQLLTQDYLQRRGEQRMLENEVLNILATEEAKAAAQDIQRRAQAQQLVETLAITDPGRLERYYTDWIEEDQALYAQLGRDFTDYVAEREAERTAPQG